MEMKMAKKSGKMVENFSQVKKLRTLNIQIEQENKNCDI